MKDGKDGCCPSFRAAMMKVAATVVVNSVVSKAYVTVEDSVDSVGSWLLYCEQSTH